jgi:aryl-phospho-beta-D-glucosidase BglC (GH1 family)
MGWDVQNKNIIYQNQDIVIKGMNWFGLETTNYDLGGLEHHNISYYLDKLSSLGFNSLRIPFSEDCIYFYPDKCISKQTNLTVIQTLDQLFDESFFYNISIVLDLHRLRTEYTSPFWELPSPSKFTRDVFIKTWSLLLSRYGNRTNLLGINLYNEPHDPFLTTDFYQDQVSQIITNLTDSFPHIECLFFIDGLKWGKDFRNFSEFSSPKILFSIHNYGPSVISTLPNNPGEWIYDWNAQFGFLFEKNKPIIIAEWGGRYKDDVDILWMDTFVHYLRENQIQNNYYWAWNPDSKDVGGFLNLDWTSYDHLKEQLLDDLVPNPTRFQFTDKYIPPPSKPLKPGKSLINLIIALSVIVSVFFIIYIVQYACRRIFGYSLW